MTSYQLISSHTFFFFFKKKYNKFFRVQPKKAHRNRRIIITAADEGKCSDSDSGLFTAGEKNPGTHSVGGWVETKTRRKHLGKCESSVLAVNRNPIFADHNLLTILIVIFLITLNTVF
jgi:hypothetical protein